MSAEGEKTSGSAGEQDRFFGAARLVAALTMLSRVLGLIRDMALVPLGGRKVADAFWLGFSVPHLFRRLFGEGALSAAFIPIFTEAAEKSGWDRARAVLANTAGLLALVLAGLVVLIEAGLLLLLLLAPGEWDRQLAIKLAMLMLPFMFTICLLALSSAALNSKGHFAYPAMAPILLNVGLIAAGWWLAPALARTEPGQFAVVGVALLLCGVVQLLGAIWLLRRSNLALMWTFRPVLPEIRQIARRMAPTVVPLSLVQVSDLLARLIAKACTASPASPDLPLVDGVVRCHYAAGRLYQLPMGVLGISVATVVFPLLSRCVARDDRSGLREALNRALRLCLFLGVPSGVGLILLAEPTVQLIFERRGFGALDTARTATMLQAYCLAMPAYFCVHILLRAFFARKDTRTPMIAAAVLAALNVLLVVAGIFTPLKSAALGAATAVTSTLNAVVLGWVLHRQIGRLGWRSLLLSTGRVAAATIVLAAAV
ncbi:MAG: murein biosynthesis integral membrane protein MurJ, partial [Phycisphaerae bacterium]